jgi:hypothetical protein
MVEVPPLILRIRHPQDKDIALLETFITLREWFANYERKAWERSILR